jgi:hypothetical protein
MTRSRRALTLTALIAATLGVALTGCSAGAQQAPDDALAIGTGVAVEAGTGVEMSFSIDDVREGKLSDLAEMGLQSTPSDDGKVPYFVTYSVTLTDGEIADADRSALPVPKTDEWKLTGKGTYRPIQVIGQFDCTPDGNATAGVAPDAPLVACQAFLGDADALPTAIEVKDLGTWATKD